MTPMDEAERQRQTDDAYRAIGRYMVEFSRLVFWMKSCMRERLRRIDNPQMLPELVFGEAPAQHIANAFFGMCRLINDDFSTTERQIGDTLASEVGKTIQKRNYIAHADWWVGFAAPDDEEISAPSLTRVKPMRSKGPFEYEGPSVDQLDESCESMKDLRNLVAEFGEIALHVGSYALWVAQPPKRVTDVFVLHGTKRSGFTVARRTPRQGFRS
jgi:hypothetical protein